jgi:hypothetical protein
MKNKPMTPQQRHAGHPNQVRVGRGPHPGELWCVQCQQHIRWIGQQQMNQLKGPAHA